MAKFKVGDVVQLNSGGPQMTVSALEKGPNESILVYCSYFEKDGKLNQGLKFNENELSLFE